VLSSSSFPHLRGSSIDDHYSVSSPVARANAKVNMSGASSSSETRYLILTRSIFFLHVIGGTRMRTCVSSTHTVSTSTPLVVIHTTNDQDQKRRATIKGTIIVTLRCADQLSHWHRHCSVGYCYFHTVEAN
jgi:hypothetical protein